MILLIFFFLIILIIFPKTVSESVGITLIMCIKSIIPSLFPFSVISDLFLTLISNRTNYIIKKISPLFNISPVSFKIFLLSFFCGYPIGGKMVLNLYENRKITEKEKDKLIIFANNAGPGFIISVLGGVLFQNAKIGIIIYISHILASISFGILVSFLPVKTTESVFNKEEKTDFLNALSLSIKNSTASMINICGVICFFSCVITLIDLIPFINTFKYKGIIFSFFEMTNAVKYISMSSLSLRLKVSLSAFCVTFGGFCVFMQLKTYSDKIKTASYFLGKLLCGIFAFIYCYYLI